MDVLDGVLMMLPYDLSAKIFNFNMIHQGRKTISFTDTIVESKIANTDRNLLAVVMNVISMKQIMHYFEYDR